MAETLNNIEFYAVKDLSTRVTQYVNSLESFLIYIFDSARCIFYCSMQDLYDYMQSIASTACC